MASNVEEARQAFLDALEEAGIDRTTAEAQTRYIMPSSATIVGNYADLQRMGAAAVTGTIPTGPAQENVVSSDLSDAFTMPPDNITRDQLGDDATISEASIDTGQPNQGTPGDGTDTGTDLNAMTKAELEDHAEAAGVDVGTSMTKAEMIQAIKGGG